VAIDKDAVSKAIKTRYGEIMKSEEYLEKIFNISFSMPKHFELKNFIKQYESFNDENAEKLARFFEYIKFTNPRHIKKVLNKYDCLVNVKISNGISKDLKNIIPDIICTDLECMKPISKYHLKKYYPNKNYIKKMVKRLNNTKNYLFDTIFVMYFVILYEFYYEKYMEIKNYDDKLTNYSKNFYNYRDSKEISQLMGEQHIKKSFKIDSNILFKEIYELLKTRNGEELFKIMNLFTPYTMTKLPTSHQFNIYDAEYLNYFKRKNNEILIDFCKYLSNKFFEIVNENKEYKNENYKFKTLFEMAETLL
jgi:hypothetical protein